MLLSLLSRGCGAPPCWPGAASSGPTTATTTATTATTATATTTNNNNSNDNNDNNNDKYDNDNDDDNANTTNDNDNNDIRPLGAAGSGSFTACREEERLGEKRRLLALSLLLVLLV